MSPQAEQPAAPEQGQAGPTPADAESPVPAAAAKIGSKRPAGVPVWRTGKPDAFLAAAVETARTALEGITAASDIGRHVAAKSEGDRLVTHLFESKLPGYAGWHWYAVVTRNSRSKVVTVSELGLLPSEDSILAPEWVPWAERVRPEDAQQQEKDTPEQGKASPETGEPAPDGDMTGTGPAGQDPEIPEFDATGSDAADNDFIEQHPGDDAGTD
ncbi:DUF3027 domain-containing protein [Pseudarthrobacter sp. NS4]|uniref:DUF3027 domain-containing protein n=1 Tax=Pseudarthrobacter sp. NS4 TaxID=2973976 RepID=UPI002161DA72|nr:DUF3027 domain-containing protein [Pseudarthrobacter sp. NS4]